MSGIESQGVDFEVSDLQMTPTFTSVGRVTSIDGPSGSAAVIDVSDLASTRKEKLMGLADEGQITLGLNLDPDDANGQMRMRTWRGDRTRGDFRLTLTDPTPTVLTFSGFVLEFSISAAVDAQLTAQATIEIDGEVTWT